MHVKRISYSGDSQWENFEITELSDIILVIGPNAVGKTRFLKSIYFFISNALGFQNNDPIVHSKVIIPSLKIELFDEEEKEESRSYNLSDGADIQKFRDSKFGKIVRDTTLPYYERHFGTMFIGGEIILRQGLNVRRDQVLMRRNINQISNEQQQQQTLHTRLAKLALDYSNEHTELTEKREEHKNWEAELKKLEQYAPDRLINQGLKDLGLAIQIQTPRKKWAEESELLFKKEGIDDPINLSYLSSGEITILFKLSEYVLNNITHMIMFFDELDAHLHWELQSQVFNYLVNQLRSSNNKGQFWISTHSMGIISEALKDETITILELKSEKGKTQINPVKRHKRIEQAIFSRLVGERLLLTKKPLLLVEGKTEMRTFAEMAKSLPSNYSNTLKNWHVIPLGGSTNIISLLELIKKDDELGDRIFPFSLNDVFCLFDLDSNEEQNKRKEKLRTIFDENRAYFLDVREIENLVFSILNPDGSLAIDDWLNSITTDSSNVKKLKEKLAKIANKPEEQLTDVDRRKLLEEIDIKKELNGFKELSRNNDPIIAFLRFLRGKNIESEHLKKLCGWLKEKLIEWEGSIS